MLAGARSLGVAEDRVPEDRVPEWPEGSGVVIGACPAAGSITCGLAGGTLADDVVVVLAARRAAVWLADPLEPHPASAMTAVSVATGARIGPL
jgi:hypothetical protein